MRRLRGWMQRLGGVFGSTRRDRDFNAELESHLQLHIDDNIRAGMTPAEARRFALIKFGGVEGVREAHRDQRGLPIVETVTRDVRDGIRLLKRTPGFTVVAVLSLALGIGANTAIFSLLDSLLLRSLPVRDPGRLVQLHRDDDHPAWSNPVWEQIRARPELFDGACAFSTTRFNLVEQGETDYADGLITSGAFFDVLGVRPALGRLFNEADDKRGLPNGPVVVISHGFWQRRFGGASDVIGKPLRLERATFTIVGVTPATFFGPEVGKRFDVIVPLAVRTRSFLDNPTAWWLTILARLKTGQTPEVAAAGLQAVQPLMRAATLPANDRPEELKTYLTKPIIVQPGGIGTSFLRGIYRQPLVVIMGVVGLVLLIACANIANLLLARGASRRHEFSVRLALGASRIQLVRQMLIESLMLSATGALVGFGFAAWGSRLLVRQISTANNVVFLDLSMNWRVLGFMAGVAIATALLFGVIPALRATRVHPNDALKEHGRAITADTAWGLGSVLVVVQVALSLVLVMGAGLFLRTFSSLAHVHLGFDRDPILVASLREPRRTGPAEDLAVRERRLLDIVGAVPGVQTAGISEMMPVGNGLWHTVVENPSGLSLSEDERDVYVNAVTPGWFKTLGTKLVAGRDLDWHDTKDAPQVVVVNQTLAAKYFPSQNPLGHTLREVTGPGETAPILTIVGVVEDAVYLSAREGVPPTMYQSGLVGAKIPNYLSVRAADGRSPDDLRTDVAAAIAEFNKSMSVTFQSLDKQVDGSLTRERMVAMLSGFFGALALLLAGLGLYGVVSYAVGRRRMEIGIRMALGASTAAVVRLIVRRVAVLVGAGLVVGGALSLWASHFVATLLFGLQPRDITTLVGLAVVLVALGGVASWLPARRAARIDPTEVLREG